MQITGESGNQVRAMTPEPVGLQAFERQEPGQVTGEEGGSASPVTRCAGYGEQHGFIHGAWGGLTIFLKVKTNRFLSRGVMRPGAVRSRLEGGRGGDHWDAGSGQAQGSWHGPELGRGAVEFGTGWHLRLKEEVKENSSFQLHQLNREW